MEVSTARNSLPNPCPLPDTFDGIVRAAIANNKIVGDVKVRLIRQAGKFYYRLCPQPTSQEYQIMAITLCEKFEQLKDKACSGAYWVKQQ